jgi:DNA-binding response OmpR family regulator
VFAFAVMDRLLKAGAIIVGNRLGLGAAIYDIAADIGFGFVRPYAGRPGLTLVARETPLFFVLFAEVRDPSVYEPIVKEIRQGGPRAIAFSPLIYFSESPSHETVAACAALGMDDVVTMPFTRERVWARLKRQIDRMQVYSETSDYLGPDRRRLSGTHATPPGRLALSAQPDRRYEIRRSLEAGSRVHRERIKGPDRLA